MSKQRAKRISRPVEHGMTPGFLARATGKIELPSSEMGKTAGGAGQTKESGATEHGAKRSRKKKHVSCFHFTCLGSKWVLVLVGKAKLGVSSSPT